MAVQKKRSKQIKYMVQISEEVHTELWDRKHHYKCRSLNEVIKILLGL